MGAVRIVRAYGPGIGSPGRVTISPEPTAEVTYERHAPGRWVAWWRSDYGNGHGIPQEDAPPELAALLERAWKEAQR